ncbi:hypothetical protein LAZ67_4001630 [Cordylochernes scorpioides]|uniref:Mos1 transposase HTH domain-containing protein n=1 Tax=Cordylochernes scorpioides TaxID=51811 RepID=A0ABY6KD64_9ARAC|nr:hypothetical protein LAZ67_4001630 [Cordylochernes scorpioides]
MAISEPKSAHLREVLLFAFNWKKSATEAYRMLEEVYSDHGLSKSQCYRWFKKFQSDDFELDNEPHGKPPQKFEDAELQALLDEDSTQMQEKLAKQLQVPEACNCFQLQWYLDIRVPQHTSFSRYEPTSKLFFAFSYERNSRYDFSSFIFITMDRKKVCKKSSAKKKIMSIELKPEIIEKHEQGVRVVDLSRQYGCSTSMICSVLKRKESIKSVTPSKGLTIISKLRTSLHENMEKLLMVWVTEK